MIHYSFITIPQKALLIIQSNYYNFNLKKFLNINHFNQIFKLKFNYLMKKVIPLELCKRLH